MTKRQPRFLAFYLDHHLCAIPSSIVREINNAHVHFEETSETPVHINHRGRVVPLFDLRATLGFAPLNLTTSTRLVFIKSQDKTVAFAVDAIHAIVDNESDLIMLDIDECLTNGGESLRQAFQPPVSRVS